MLADKNAGERVSRCVDLQPSWADGDKLDMRWGTGGGGGFRILAIYPKPRLEAEENQAAALTRCHIPFRSDVDKLRRTSTWFPDVCACPRSGKFKPCE